VNRLSALFVGGSDGNERLTAANAVVLLVLLAAEGATLIAVVQLLVVHVFLGFLLVPPVALKLASTGWRMTSYYRRSDEYLRRGPPHWLLRYIVGPVVVLSTIALFGTGVLAVALGRRGLVLGLHKLSFVIWFGAMSIHGLGHLLDLPRAAFRDWWRSDRLGGRRARRAILAGALAAGLALAVLTVPLADHWQDAATGLARLDGS
jgi:hypothetical protein